jgi:type II secretory pathway component PulF
MRLDPRALLRWFELLDFRLKRAEFYRDLVEMYKRGESMLSFLEGELNNALLTKQHSRAAALRIVLRRYASGVDSARLGMLLRGVMPERDAMMIAAVEHAGTRKTQALEALAVATELQAQMRQAVLAQSATPLLIAPVCLIMISVVSDVILSIDRSTPVYVRDQIWTGFNGLAKQIADFSIAYGGTAVAALGAVLTLAALSLPRWTGRWRLKADKWPLYSLYRDFQAGLLLSSLAMLLQTSATLRGSLEDMAARSNPVMRWHLARVLRSLDVEPNATLRAFGRGLLSPHLLARAATLQRTAGQFSDVLVQLGTSEGNRVLARVKRAASAMNIALISVLGGLAAILGMASITVPGAFSSVMEPAQLMAAKKAYEQRKKYESTFQPPPSNDGTTRSKSQ